MYDEAKLPVIRHTWTHNGPLLSVLFLASLIPTGLFAWAYYLDANLSLAGETATAKVTRAHTRHPSGGSVSYYIEYDFSPPGSFKSYRSHWLYRWFHASVSGDVYYRAKRSGRIKVVYLANDPSMNRAEEPGMIVAVGLLLGVMVMANVGLFWLYRHAYYAGQSSGGRVNADDWSAGDWPAKANQDRQFSADTQPVGFEDSQPLATGENRE